MKNNEWKSITNPEELFKLKRQSWEIQVRSTEITWTNWTGRYWDINYQYQVRPAQPKMKKVKLEAWLSEYELRWLNVEAGNKPAPHWTRVPSEDKEIKVPDNAI